MDLGLDGPGGSRWWERFRGVSGLGGPGGFPGIKAPAVGTDRGAMEGVRDGGGWVGVGGVVQRGREGSGVVQGVLGLHGPGGSSGGATVGVPECSEDQGCGWESQG